MESLPGNPPSEAFLCGKGVLISDLSDPYKNVIAHRSYILRWAVLLLYLF